MKICKRCVLPDTFPGIHFNQDSICSHCVADEQITDSDSEKKQYRRRFEDMLAHRKGTAEYDCAVSYSGGKDSSYTVYLLRQVYRLRVLAVTVDNGFIPDQTFANIHAVCDSAGADSMIIKPAFAVLKKIFNAAAAHALFSPKALERASSICTSCIGLVKFILLRTAVEKKIPIVAWGWSPGQAPLRSSIMKTTPAFIASIQKPMFDPLTRIARDGIAPYFLNDRHLSLPADYFPYLVSPLAFMPYNEKNIMRIMQSIGWRRPRDLDANSSNCRLNSFANAIHLKRYGFHPYALELSYLVRQGVISRREGLKRISAYGSPKTIRRVKKMLRSSL